MASVSREREMVDRLVEAVAGFDPRPRQREVQIDFAGQVPLRRPAATRRWRCSRPASRRNLASAGTERRRASAVGLVGANQHARRLHLLRRYEQRAQRRLAVQAPIEIANSRPTITGDIHSNSGSDTA